MYRNYGKYTNKCTFTGCTCIQKVKMLKLLKYLGPGSRTYAMVTISLMYLNITLNLLLMFDLHTIKCKDVCKSFGRR